MMIHFFSHRIVSITFVEDRVTNQSFKLNYLETVASLFKFLYSENSVSYLLSAVLRILVLFSLSLQQMITFYVTSSGSRRN